MHGAYDAGVEYNPNGSLSFYSFKDLETLPTFRIFEQAILILSNGEFR